MTCSVVAGPNASSLQLPVYSGGKSHHPDDDRERSASEKEGRRKYILKSQRADIKDVVFANINSNVTVLFKC